MRRIRSLSHGWIGVKFLGTLCVLLEPGKQVVVEFDNIGLFGEVAFFIVLTNEKEMVPYFAIAELRPINRGFLL